MKKDIVRKTYSEVRQVIDSETGELLDETIKEIKIVVNQDEFALIYASFWNAITKHKLQMPDIELLGKLISDYSDNRSFTISKAVRKELAQITGRPYTTYYNSTKRLVQYRFIVPTEPGARTYRINPRYAFKGSSNNRRRALIEMISICPEC